MCDELQQSRPRGVAGEEVREWGKMIRTSGEKGKEDHFKIQEFVHSFSVRGAHTHKDEHVFFVNTAESLATQKI